LKTAFFFAAIHVLISVLRRAAQMVSSINHYSINTRSCTQPSLQSITNAVVVVSNHTVS